MLKPENKEVLDEIIIGRVKPHIYAFTTDTIPNYLKVGDTYRPVPSRLREWMRVFPNLHKEYEDSAVIGDDENVFFRDYSVHRYLEERLGKSRLQPGEYPDAYYSNEFFRDVQVEHVADAIKDIRDNYTRNTGIYKYYDANSRLPETYTYASAGMWDLRPNQKDTVERFVKAVNAGRKNLLMYAVMRFGKSFTSLCCAKKIGAKVVLVVSGKADVREEWKKTVQSAENFNKDYRFLVSDDLERDAFAITTILAEGKGVVVFLTLQDLQGKTIKDKHKDIFGQEIDLLIVDETHYGARAESYGEVVRSAHYEKDEKDSHADDDFVEMKEAEKQLEKLKVLNVKITLHLSGTPYRILMGSEFSKEDIIAFYQFSDIVKDQEDWDRQYLLNDTENVKEWDNPYYGFPQMVRFAFAPGKSAAAVLESLKSSGTTYAFSALLKPISLKKDTKSFMHRKFKYEKEVLELFEAIDGSREEEGVLSFLDYDKIKEGKMCQHMVCVLPYCASCDALEALIHDNRDRFKNLQNYTIINISGIDAPNKYRNIQSVKSKIKQCVTEGKKTLTLTVNRMLTGSTVEEWDTMIFLKDTASPQEYDQAIFRLQNQYIREYVGNDGDVIKFNMKPQTLLVDFDPHRMFVMQEKRSQIYNANTDASGNRNLSNRIEEELRISPIITLNKNRIEQVKAKAILDEISEYSCSRGVVDEAKEIPVDMSLLEFDMIKDVIQSQAEMGTRQGLSIDTYEGNESEFDKPEEDDIVDEIHDSEKNDRMDEEENIADNGEDTEEDSKSFEAKFQTFYSRILFFVFLTKSSVASLEDILNCVDKDENARIVKNLSLSRKVMSLMKKHMNIFILRQLDYKVQNINTLARDETIDPIQRASIAVRKFGRISNSEITTPELVADNMISLIPEECFRELKTANTKILDIASKMGEFSVAIVKRCSKLGISVSDIKDKVISIATSPIAYEFTRKIYEVLGLDVDAIAKDFYSYDLLKVRAFHEDGSESNEPDYIKISNILSQKKKMSMITLSDKCSDLKEDNKMKFSAIVGNPPYQEADGGAGASSKPIYPYFVDISRKMNPSFASIIIPSRWYAGGKHLNDFRKSMLDDIHIRELHDCLHPEEIFPNTNNRGGICYILWDEGYDNQSSDQMKVVTHNGGGEVSEAVRPMRTRDLDIFIRNASAISILDKVIPNHTVKTMQCYISSRKPFGIESKIIGTDDWHRDPGDIHDPVECYGKGRILGYLSRDKVTSRRESIDKWKVFTPRANNVGTELNDDNLNTFVGTPGQICTEAYIMIGAELELDRISAEHLARYFNTKFVRFMHGLAKSSHDASKTTYRFVPVVDFSEEWTDEKLYAKFGLTQSEIEHIESSIKPMK